jgi:putative solute:sodium symporter small subunit
MRAPAPRTPYTPRAPQPEPELAGPFPPDLHDVRHLWLKAGLLAVWVLVSFVATYFARDLQRFTLGDWPLGYWLAAQGAVLVFIGIVVLYAWAMSRFERQDAARAAAQAAFSPAENAVSVGSVGAAHAPRTPAGSTAERYRA